jgi:hypothetical protein
MGLRSSGKALTATVSLPVGATAVVVPAAVVVAALVVTAVVMPVAVVVAPLVVAAVVLIAAVAVAVLIAVLSPQADNTLNSRNKTTNISVNDCKFLNLITLLLIKN